MDRLRECSAPSGHVESGEVQHDIAVAGQRNGRARDCSLSVLIPRFGEKPRRRTIYIGTENTYTQARFQAALERAIEMRTAAEQAYEAATTHAKRAQAREHKKLLKERAAAE